MLGTLVLSMRLVRNVRRRLTRAIEDLKNRHRGARTIGIGVAAPVLAVLLICLAATTAVDLILVVAPNYEIPFSWILIHLNRGKPATVLCPLYSTVNTSHTFLSVLCGSRVSPTPNPVLTKTSHLRKPYSPKAAGFRV